MLLNKHDLENGGVHVAGRGTTALGIVGTVLGGVALGSQFMNNNGCGGNGSLWGLFGNNNNNCGCNATKYDLCQAERIGALESVIAKLEAEKYSDNTSLSLYSYVVNSDKDILAKVNDLFNATFKEIGDLKVAEQVNKMEIDKNLQLLNQKIDYENKLTACSINAVKTYVDATFIPAIKRISLCDICPTPAVAPAVQPTQTCCSGN